MELPARAAAYVQYSETFYWDLGIELLPERARLCIGSKERHLLRANCRKGDPGLARPLPTSIVPSRSRPRCAPDLSSPSYGGRYIVKRPDVLGAPERRESAQLVRGGVSGARYEGDEHGGGRAFNPYPYRHNGGMVEA